MARKAYGLHATQVNTSTYPDDGTSPVGSNEWNEALDPQGMLGFTPQTSTVTIASGALLVTDTITVVAGQGGAADDLDSITLTNTSEYDLLYLFGQSGYDVTLKHGDLNVNGEISTVSGADEVLSATKPTILIRKGNYWYGYGGGTVSDLSITTAKLAADAVTGAKLADNAVDSEHYTDGSIDLVHLAADSVNGTKIADDAIDSEHYTDASIDTAHIANLQITTGLIAADAVTAAKIGDNVIDSEHYAAASIDNEHLANDAVGADELASDAVVNASVASGAAIATSKLSGAVTGIASHGLATSATTDTTSASNVTSGTLPNAQLPDIVVADLAAAAVTLESEGISSNDNDTSFPTSAAVKDFVDTTVASDITLKGDYNASTDSPSLDDGSPIAGIVKGDHYVVSTAGTFFSEVLQAGDSIISKQDSPTTFAHWIVVNNNVVTPVVGANIANDAIDSQHYADGSIDNAHIADDAIDSEHYADGSIDNAHIADDAIDSEHYAAGSIDTAHIANLQVTTALIAADAIDGTKLADDAVAAEHVASNAIVQASIADNAVGIAELAGIARGKIIIGDASGDPALLAAGADNTVLTMDSSGDVGWEAPAGGSISGDQDYSGLHDIFDLQRLSLEIQAVGFDSDSTNNPAITNETTLYSRVIDSNNDGIFCRVKKNGANVYLQIA